MKQLNYHEISAAKEKQNSIDYEVILILDNITSQANLGALFRLADAVKIKEVYLHNIQPFAPGKLKRFSRKCHEYVSYRYVSTQEIIDLKTTHDLVACEWTNNSVPVWDYNWKSPTAIILGSESYGISQSVLDLCDAGVHMPMAGRNSSLNVAMAGGIAVYACFQALQRL